MPGEGTAGRLATPRAPTRQIVFALPGLGTASQYELLRAESAVTVLTGYCLGQKWWAACIRCEGRGE